MPDPEFTLLGDAIWLDFVNTGQGRRGDPTERLPDLASYHRWTKAQKLGSDSEQLTLDQVLGFRERLTALAAALAEDGQVPAATVDEINRMLRTITGNYQLIRAGGQWKVQFTPDREMVGLNAIAHSAAKTLAHKVSRIHQCSSPTCTLYYVDDTPSQSRKWCSVEPCGRLNRPERRRSDR